MQGSVETKEGGNIQSELFADYKSVTGGANVELPPNATDLSLLVFWLVVADHF